MLAFASRTTSITPSPTLLPVQKAVSSTSTSTLVPMRWTTSEYASSLDDEDMVADDTTPCSAIANKESLSVLETEMRKIEGIVKEINDELEYLRRRESRFADTNGSSPCHPCRSRWLTYSFLLGCAFALRVIGSSFVYPALWCHSCPCPAYPVLPSLRSPPHYLPRHALLATEPPPRSFSARTFHVPVSHAPRSSLSHLPPIRRLS